jgi:hypothetical protein
VNWPSEHIRWPMFTPLTGNTSPAVRFPARGHDHYNPHELAHVYPYSMWSDACRRSPATSAGGTDYPRQISVRDSDDYIAQRRWGNRVVAAGLTMIPFCKSDGEEVASTRSSPAVFELVLELSQSHEALDPNFGLHCCTSGHGEARRPSVRGEDRRR